MINTGRVTSNYTTRGPASATNGAGSSLRARATALARAYVATLFRDLQEDARALISRQRALDHTEERKAA